MSVKAPGLFKFWQSLLLVVLPACIAVVVYAFIGMPLVNREAASINAQEVAEAKAGAIDNGLQILSNQLEGMSRLSGLRQALKDNDQAAVDMMVAEWSLMFADLNRLVIFPLGELGIADLGEHSDKLRNNIEKDMVGRSAKEGRVIIDVYQYEGAYVVSLARAVYAGNRSIGAIMLSLNADWLQAQLESLVSGDRVSRAGVTSLQYEMAGARPVVVLQDSSALQMSPDIQAEARADLASSSNLKLHYTLLKSQSVLSALTPIILLLFAALLAFGVLALVRQRASLNHLLAADAGALKYFIEESFGKSPARPQLSLPAFEHVVDGFVKSLRNYREKRAASFELKGATDADDKAATGDWQNPNMTAKIEIDHEEGSGQAQPAIPAHIFRAYDIRGIADTELNDDNVVLIGKAIGSAALTAGHQQLVVGRDGRLSSERIQQSLLQGLLSTGVDVIELGVVATPLVYFAAEHLNTRAGVMITGSHNSPEYNGFKMVMRGQALADQQIQQLRQTIESGELESGEGSRTTHDIIDAYIDHIADDVVFASPLKVVLDCGNGAASEIAPMLYASLGCEVLPLFAEIDGSFPNHLPDPGNADNLQALIAEVTEQGADLGLAFDGDADRVVAVTGSGRIVDSDKLLMLFARDVLTRNPGADVVYDIKCSRNLSQVISSHGGRPVMWQSGHSRIKQKMLETGALLGGEFSGHFFFKERWFGFDDGLYSGTRLIEMLTLEGASLDEALTELPDSVSSPEINIPLDEADKFATIESLAASSVFDSGEITRLDGVRVDYPEGWGLIRASNTSAKLTARFEADSEQALREIQQTFADALAAVNPELQLPL